MRLYEACKNGDREQVDKLIENGTIWWDNGLVGACSGGHIDLVNLMIEKGATDWNWGLMGACEGGQLEMANLMIEKGADITRLYKNYLDKLRMMRLNKFIENHLVRVENRKNLFIVDFQRDLMNRTEKYL